MEFLIPGLVLVGFMVWASTRIKRSAAKAFEAEVIETPDYTLSKPDGFLSIVDPPDGLLFSAYSKEFGEGETSRVRRATARVRRFPDAHFDDITERAKIEGSDIISEDTGIIGGHKCATIVMRRLDQGVALESHHKVIAGPDCIYEMAVDLLPEYKDEMRPKIDELLGSFLLT